MLCRLSSKYFAVQIQLEKTPEKGVDFFFVFDALTRGHNILLTRTRPMLH